MIALSHRYGPAGAQPARRSALLPACLIALAVFFAAFGPALAQSATPEFTPRDETPEEFPAATGRDETFYACTACHGFKLVAQQGMNRRQWDETLTWMSEKHGMPPLQGDSRRQVLDYLEAAFPSRPPTHPGSSPNPFLRQ